MQLKDKKTRERIAIILLVVILAFAGIILIRDDSTPIKYNQASNNSSVSSAENAVVSQEEPQNQVSDTKVAGKVNINTASIEDLDTLPGIGEKTAQKIIDYRKLHNGFKTLVELKEVSGIGDSKYDSVKDLISI